MKKLREFLQATSIIYLPLIGGLALHSLKWFGLLLLLVIFLIDKPKKLKNLAPHRQMRKLDKLSKMRAKNNFEQARLIRQALENRAY